MKTVVTKWCAVFAMALPLLAQGGTPIGDAKDAAAKTAEPKMSSAGRQGLLRCKELAGSSKELTGSERAQVLAQAASAYDRLIVEFSAEPGVAAAAAFAAADLWRKHGSLPLAEKDYLFAARTDGPHYEQRGLLGAADMQRRQKRNEEALASYDKAVAAEPATARAQTARLARVRLLTTMERFDEAQSGAQAALECAKPGRQVIDASNQLAYVMISKGDFDAAGRALEHAEQSIVGIDNGDPIVAERLQKAVDSMSARKALQRARDKANGAGADAAKLDADRRAAKGTGSGTGNGN